MDYLKLCPFPSISLPSIYNEYYNTHRAELSSIITDVDIKMTSTAYVHYYEDNTSGRVLKPVIVFNDTNDSTWTGTQDILIGQSLSPFIHYIMLSTSSPTQSRRQRSHHQTERRGKWTRFWPRGWTSLCPGRFEIQSWLPSCRYSREYHRLGRGHHPYLPMGWQHGIFPAQWEFPPISQLWREQVEVEAYKLQRPSIARHKRLKIRRCLLGGL